MDKKKKKLWWDLREDAGTRVVMTSEEILMSGGVEVGDIYIRYKKELDVG